MDYRETFHLDLHKPTDNTVPITQPTTPARVSFLLHKVNLMMHRSNAVMERAIKRAVQLCKIREFKLAQKILKTAGVTPLAVERVLYEPHNIRHTD